MSLSLSEIATEVAAQYPAASQQRIVDIIIDSIESEAIIFQVVSSLTIPTPVQLKQAKLKSTRLPRKRLHGGIVNERKVLLEHIENARLFKQLKAFYTAPLDDTTLGPVMGLDGARVTLLPAIKRTSASHQDSPRQVTRTIYGTQATIPITSHGNTLAHTYNEVSDIPEINSRQVTFSSQDFLTGLGTNTGNPLSLYDVYRMIALLFIYPEDDQILLKIDETIRNDIKLRNRDSKSDCCEELYRGDSQLPQDLRINIPKISDLPSMTLQHLRAVILDEYQRLQTHAGQQFINGELTYDDYVQTENEYANLADELMAALT